ncbi:hypothetical protein MHBO_001499 [Bonamia ostreae]|uniref:Ubiquitin-like domain-containing protein n=1 Tax=Bonamia ostreae TaxID=126728 RepID=A0ABV2AKD2_9EUKA
MQLFFNNINGQSIALPVSPFEKLHSVKNRLSKIISVPVSQMLLSSRSSLFEENSTLLENNLADGNSLDISLRLRGGAIEPNLIVLAEKYNVNKMVCRKCYARLPPRATNCRKKKCGHSNKLRPKKKMVISNKKK